ncbi:hypothetical protein BC826DRAFT_976469 [Russula brevipes]|nr:hypothetical protein BC826DRAFT_976469 [Russula brevipes]
MALSLSFPPTAAIEILDGSNWPLWSSRFVALLRMNGQCKHVTSDPDSGDKEWDTVEEMILGVLEMYVQKDVWTFVADESKFGTCKLKFEELKHIYGGAGSMSTFNTWISLTSTILDETSPMFPQLQKLNDTRITLANNEMTITDLQFCFILIKALPESYSSVASTILASGAPENLSARIIQDRIINEEGRWKNPPAASLNKVTLQDDSLDPNHHMPAIPTPKDTPLTPTEQIAATLSYALTASQKLLAVNPEAISHQ